jgi:hypothetical protein
MLHLPYKYKYRKIGDKQVRIYEIPCPQCSKLRWIKIYKRHSLCRSCAHMGQNNSASRQKYDCTYLQCTKQITKNDYYCKLHRRLKIDRYKVKARWAVHNAIESGKLIREPCEVCNKEPTDAHHPDHKRPFYIKWLCRAHHMKEHGGRFRPRITLQPDDRADSPS